MDQTALLTIRRYILCVALAVCFLATPAAWAQDKPSTSLPVLLEADHMGYDQEKDVVVALGNVEVVQGETIVVSDKLTYYVSENVVVAESNVSMLRPDGTVYMAEKVQLKDDLERGVINKFRVFLVDNSRFAAVEARRVSESQLELKNASYTPCKLCEGSDPLWQFKARDIEVDDEREVIEYYHAFLEVYGVPVVYTPYFSHATPNASRQTGFLTPEYGTSSNFGATLVAPIYLNMGADKEALVTPTFTEEEGVVVDTDYTQLFDSGNLRLNFSLTAPEKRDVDGNRIDGNEFRGHIFTQGDFTASENWKLGFDINRSTDDTYLRRYRYTNSFDLTSVAYGRYLGGGRNYFEAESLAFQGLRESADQDQIPFILPHLSGYYETEPGMWDARFFTRADTRVLSRDDGPRSQRASLTTGVKVPIATSGGHLIDFTTQLRQDAYAFQDVVLNGSPEDGSELRTIPQASLHWRYPLISSSASGSLTIEPNVLMVATSRGSNPNEIVDEENLGVELSDINLFSTDPFAGNDLVDESSRVTYGLRGQWYSNSNYHLYFMLGQSYLITNDTPFPYNNDPGADFSDYVARVDASLGESTEISYFTQFSQDSLEALRHELRSTISIDPVLFSVIYTNEEETRLFERSDEIFVSTNVQVTDNWAFNASGRRDLRGQGSMISHGFGLTYSNDCIAVQTAAERFFTQDRDLEQETRFLARVFLKNLDY